MSPANVALLLAAILLLGACAEDEGETQIPSPTPAATATAAVVTVAIAPDGLTADVYWNGGAWPQLPVYSLQHGISQTAHEHFQTCGASDASIEDLVSVHREQASARITLNSRIVVSARGVPDATPTFSRIMDTERLEPNVYLVTCELQ